MKAKIIRLSKKIIKHELISGSFYLFVAAIGSGFLAFILNIFFARTLTKPDYGVYAPLLSLITLFTIPAASLTPIIVKFAGHYNAKNETAKMEKFYLKMTKLFLVVALIIFFLFLVASPFLKSFLKLDNFYYIFLVGIITSVSYLNIVNAGFLQGLLKFPFFAFTQIAGVIARIIVGVVLVLLGFKVFGAVLAAFFTIFVAYLLGFIPLRFLFKKEKGESDVKIPTKELIQYFLPVTVTVLCLSSFISIDVILVKHFFNPLQAGFYGGLSLVGKVIFYFTGPIPTAMFALLVRRLAKNEPINKLFYLALLLVFIPSVLIAGFFFLFPGFTVKLFLGKGFETIIPLLGLFGLYIGIFSLLNVCVNLFLSLKKTFVFIPVFIGSLLQIILISLFHNNFYQIIFVSMLISGLLFIGLFLYFIFGSKKVPVPQVENSSFI
jgi:O-antigen/teichoic acid export membrane protein